MPRKVRDSNLETRTARSRLKARHKPYFRMIEPGLHLGYRKLAGGPGTWAVRRYIGNGSYAVENLRAASGHLVVADDYSEPDGARVLSFGQAQEQAKAYRADAGRTGPYTIGLGWMIISGFSKAMAVQSIRSMTPAAAPTHSFGQSSRWRR